MTTTIGGRAAVRAITAAAGLAASAAAQVPTYPSFQIQAATGLTLFNLPSGSSLSSESPQINNARQVAFRYIAPNLTAYWRGQNAAGGTIATVDQSGEFFLTSDASLSETGDVAWASQSPANGIYRSVGGAPAVFVTNQPLGTSTFGSPVINDLGQIGYRAGFNSGQAWASFDIATSSTAIHAAEAGISPGSPVVFLFTPSFNNARQIAGKITLASGNAQQEIRVYAASGAFTTIARTADLDPASPFQSFDNSLGFSNSGHVAFVASRTPAAGGGRAVFLKPPGAAPIVTIAAQGQGPISSSGSNNIEFFPPAVNAGGLVAFRAFNAQGARAVWVGDGQTLRAVATKGQPITGPQGQNLFIGRTDTSPDFGGRPDLNDAGDVIFNAQLNDGVQVVGAAVVIANASTTPACYANCDGSTSAPALNALDFGCFLTRYRAGETYANCDGSTSVPTLNALDFGCFLQRYQQGCN